MTDKITWADDNSSFTISDLQHEQGDETYEYTVDLTRFRIEQISTNGDSQKTLTVNPQDTLWFETESATGAPHMYNASDDSGWDIATLKT